VDTPVRSCFLIDGGGVIRGAWRYDDDEVPDVEELARAAVSLGGE
jgi:peroxiredoxin